MDLPAIFHLFEGLDYLGPGSEETTRKALALIPELPQEPRIVDLGCGTGRQTMTLLRHFRSPIVAVDVHQPFLDQLAIQARTEGLGDLLETRAASMEQLAEPEGSLDLVWSEGALYSVGVAQMLQRLFPLLRSGGVIAFSEGVWFGEDRPADAVAHWQEYPDMTDEPGTQERIAAAGFRPYAHFRAPASDWHAYYEPLKSRVAALRQEAKSWPALAEVLDGMAREIAVYEQHGDCYGYSFFFAVKP